MQIVSVAALVGAFFVLLSLNGFFEGAALAAWILYGVLPSVVFLIIWLVIELIIARSRRNKK